ncbi:Chaperone protein dnaK [Candidatus Haloredivivus sp. G17]|nr:Chaperone protein dnaK [Candidatus Haloredivivus sp. G17]
MSRLQLLFSAYGLDDDQDKQVLVYDFGGGTFDVTVLEMGDGIYEVQSTEGDNDLGGDDFDEEIVEWILDKFEEENDIRLENDAIFVMTCLRMAPV